MKIVHRAIPLLLLAVSFPVVAEEPPMLVITPVSGKAMLLADEDGTTGQFDVRFFARSEGGTSRIYKDGFDCGEDFLFLDPNFPVICFEDTDSLLSVLGASTCEDTPTHFCIGEGETRLFTLKVVLSPLVGGKYRLQLRGIPTGSRIRYLPPARGFMTSLLFVRGIYDD
ncbi:MAG: hypothetical protein KBD16_04225 [Candidatus Pacebacteria bacterium]|nr:hypothetical protein [Candidatus Paceibacterota bacterium]